MTSAEEWNTVLSAYQDLLDRKFNQGLTSEEEIELHSLGARLDELDAETPIEQAIDKQAQSEHEQRINTFSNIISQLRQLEGSSP